MARRQRQPPLLAGVLVLFSPPCGAAGPVAEVQRSMEREHAHWRLEKLPFPISGELAMLMRAA
jgi:hypothetical protein